MIPAVAHGQVQPEVAHHGGDERVARELVARRAWRARGWPGSRSPSTSAPDASTARQRSASPSCAMPRSAPCSRTARRTQVEVRGADPVVDVQPVRLGRDGDDLGAGPPVDLGRDRRRRAVRAVDDHAQPVERAGRGDEQVIGVAGVGVVGQVADPADRRAGGARRPATSTPFLDRVLDGVGQLVPSGGEQLDAVVRHRVVRRGDHHAEVGVERAHQVRDGGRGQHADAERVGARSGEPGDDRGLQHLAAGPRIAADDGDRAVRRGPRLGQDVRGARVGERHRELRGEHLAVGEAAHAVGTEQTPARTHGQRLLY